MQLGVKELSLKTLRKYGLTLEDFLDMVIRQQNVCAVCKTLPPSGRLNVDHAHIKGWSKLPPEERKQYVRGLVCYRDNYWFLSKGMTADRSKAITEYLEAFESRLLFRDES